MRCKDCKYFTYWSNNMGECGHDLMVDDNRKEAECPINGVLATCDEGRGDLIVGEEFGCIHFKQKEGLL
jgi:hypothetical protein